MTINILIILVIAVIACLVAGEWSWRDIQRAPQKHRLKLALLHLALSFLSISVGLNVGLFLGLYLH